MHTCPLAQPAVDGGVMQPTAAFFQSRGGSESVVFPGVHLPVGFAENWYEPMVGHCTLTQLLGVGPVWALHGLPEHPAAAYAVTVNRHFGDEGGMHEQAPHCAWPGGDRSAWASSTVLVEPGQAGAFDAAPK